MRGPQCAIISTLNAAVFSRNRHINFHLLAALKPLVSLLSRKVACSARIRVDRQTDRQRDRQPSLRMRAEGKSHSMTAH